MPSRAFLSLQYLGHLIIKQEVLGINNRLFSSRYIPSDLHGTENIENTASSSSSVSECVFVGAGTCLASRFLANLGGKRHILFPCSCLESYLYQGHDQFLPHPSYLS
jgi:hypothetical protein